MRKKYGKPGIIVEEFALTQQIAACTVNISFGTSQCVIEDIDSTAQMKNLAASGMFTNECIIPASVGQEFDGICYHTNVQSIFSS
ncbi:MAG: hypothetical protein Q4A12_02100 [Eubacteriales bacterium]|nr:hypothetical protein [Eubacteriales bacterium]